MHDSPNASSSNRECLLIRQMPQLLLTFLCLAGTSNYVFAEQTDPLDPFLQCGELEASNERLACLDAALEDAGRNRANAYSTESSSQKLQSAHRAEEHVPPQSTPPTNQSFPASGNISAKVVRVWETPRGGLGVDLDNGQSWAQIETKTLILRPDREVEITQNVLGGHRLTMIGSNRSTLVRRIK